MELELYMNFAKGGQTKTPQRNTNCQRSKIPKKNNIKIYISITQRRQKSRGSGDKTAG